MKILHGIIYTILAAFHIIWLIVVIALVLLIGVIWFMLNPLERLAKKISVFSWPYVGIRLIRVGLLWIMDKSIEISRFSSNKESINNKLNI